MAKNINSTYHDNGGAKKEKEKVKKIDEINYLDTLADFNNTEKSGFQEKYLELNEDIYNLTYANQDYLPASGQTSEDPNRLKNPIINNMTLANSNLDIEELLRGKGLYSRKYINNHMYNGFRRFGYEGIINPYDTPSMTKEYVFFTKPDLNILGTGKDYESGSNDPLAGLNNKLKSYPFFIDAYSRYRNVLEELCQSFNNSNIDAVNVGNDLKFRKPNRNSNFIPLLSNNLISELSLPGMSSEYIETNANAYGTMIKYRGSSSGTSNYGFSLEFQDTRYNEIYMFFRIYDEYINNKNMGFVAPKVNQIWRKILHDNFSIYKFVVDEDGTTILHYAKLTGVTPSNAPMDAFSNMNNTDFKGKISIEFNATWVEDMNPYILKEFNAVSSSPIGGITELIKRNECSLYNPYNHHPNGAWPSYPYVYWDWDSKVGDGGEQNYNSGLRKYFLRWKY